MLNPGTKLGPYEIQASAGAGGMGEVYRARDSRLERSVAIKVLPNRLSDDPQRRERMQREARAISSLQHPNICALFDIGSQDGTDYLVMEFLEGETLAERLRRGPLPLPAALKVGMEVASALDKAHKSGIVHRDLKPGNIMLTKTGAKLMDFGLSKPAPLAAAAGASEGATLSAALTTEGAVIGTVPYMAPEQLENKEADVRSDIFALGAVLYEAITGRRAFTGKSQASVVAAILERDPEPITATQPLASPALDAVVKVCLAKEPDERWQSAHDVAVQLQLIGAARANGDRPTSRDKLALVGWVALVVVGLGIMAGVLAWRLWPPSTVSGPVRFSVAVPAPLRLDVDRGPLALALSPDGKTLAYVAVEGSVARLFLRRLDRFDAAPVPDSDGAMAPFFSPDGRAVGFAVFKQLKSAPVDGGPAVVLGELPAVPSGGAWSETGVIIVTARDGSVVMKIPATGGRVESLPVAPTPDLPGESGARIRQSAPSFLPGGKILLLTRGRGTGQPDVLALTLATGQVRRLLENAGYPKYAAGHLVYWSEGKLWAVGFDPITLAISGKPIVLTEDVYRRASYAISDNLLAYCSSASAGRREVVWVNPAGLVETLSLPVDDYVDVALSPDGTRIAAAVRQQSATRQVLEVYDVRSGTVMQLPTPPSSTMNAAPVWTPDGKSVVYMASMVPSYDILRSAADGGGALERLGRMDTFSVPSSIAPDGTIALSTGSGFAMLGPNARRYPPGEPRQQAVFSPDGRWLAYTGADAAGAPHIYVEPYPGPGARYQISSEGGVQPQWSRDGRRLYFRNGSKMFMVSVQTRPTFAAGKPVLLFDKEFDRGGSATNYAVASDGRLLMVRSAENNGREIRVLLNWTAALKN